MPGNSAGNNASILEVICQQRLVDIAESKSKLPLDALKSMVDESNKEFPLVNFLDKLHKNRNAGRISLMAEVKRASPSKGDIAPNMNAAEQGFSYAQAGASVISCLTEPHWFKGTLDDMKSIRKAIDCLGPLRPAVLRKDFLLDEYQIYEARIHGSDTVLLIVAAMGDQLERKLKLEKLIECSRSLGMEPLVEVNNDDEMKLALEVGAKVIGINNRNLHTFSVDLSTTTSLVAKQEIPRDVIVCALSGITTRDDVAYFESVGVKAVLVGEALMRASNPREKVKELLGEQQSLVKICGVMDEEVALAVCESGADFIGLVFAEKSRRRLNIEQAKRIVEAVHKWRSRGTNEFGSGYFGDNVGDKRGWFTGCAEKLKEALKECKPLIVAVFSDNDIEEVNTIAKDVGVDLIQLSGSEGFDAALHTCLPTIKAVHVGNQTAEEILKEVEPGKAIAFLLDTLDPRAKGGTGTAFEWSLVQGINMPWFLAGGLTEDNVQRAVNSLHPFAIDVSSGVETERKKDISKINNFVRLAKNA